jgi:DNA-binding response OmpR family regulator
MLPTRAYQDAVVSPRPQVDERSVMIVVASRADAERFPPSTFTRLSAQNTAEAISLITRMRPRVLVVDLDLPEVDGQQVVSAATRVAHTGVLVTTQMPERVPAAIKAGCHAVLLKPFVPNLAAARIARMCREMPTSAVEWRTGNGASYSGTHRVWPNTACPTCNTAGATSFEFSSYRRSWYACLACNAVWLGPRQE